MTPEEKRSVQVALSLKYGVKKAACSCCAHKGVRVMGDLPKDTYRLLCLRTNERVKSDDVCPDYQPPRLRGRAAEMIMMDEVSFPDKPWRNLLA